MNENFDECSSENVTLTKTQRFNYASGSLRHKQAHRSSTLSQSLLHKLIAEYVLYIPRHRTSVSPSVRYGSEVGQSFFRGKDEHANQF